MCLQLSLGPFPAGQLSSPKISPTGERTTWILLSRSFLFSGKQTADKYK